VANLVEGQRQLFQARLESVSNEIEQLSRRRGQITNQVEGIEAQQAALTEQLDLIRRELTDQQSLLDRGLAQASRVLALQREQSRLSGQVGELTAQKAQAEGRITEIEIEILKLGSRRREEAITRLRDLQAREVELAERRRALSGRLERMEMRAPVSGIIYGMTVTTPRSVLKPADPVLFLVPQDRPLVIVAQVEPIHIDKLHVGQEVTLRFSAFDQRTTPEVEGVLERVSPDLVLGDGAPHYVARVGLAPGEASRLGARALVPGMPVEVFLRTSDRTLLSHVAKPMGDHLARAFRQD